MQVWFVTGEDMEGRYVPALLDSKETAERYAQMMYPLEKISERECRIHSHDILTMSDLNGG